MINMEVAPSSERPNSELGKQDTEELNGKDRDVPDKPSDSIGADLPQAEDGSSVVKKRKRKKDKKSSAPIIDDCDPNCLEDLPMEKVSPENNSPHGTETVPEEPLVNVISDLVPAESLPHNAESSSKRKRKRKKSTIGAAPDSENSCLEASVGICTTTNSEKAEQHADVLPLQKQKKSLKIHESNDRSCESPRTNKDRSYSPEKMKKKRKKMLKAYENSYKSCDPSVGTSLVEDIMPTVDESLQPPAAVLSEQELEVAVAQPPIDGVSTNTKRKKKKKLKKEGKTHESNDEICGNDKGGDLPVAKNIMPGIHFSQQPPVSESSEQKLELAQPLTEGVSAKTNPESCELIAEFIPQSKRKKKNRKKRRKSHESNDESCGNDKGRDLSVAENSVPGIDSSQQPLVSESSEQKLELAQPLTEGISTKTNSESSELVAELIPQSKRKKKSQKKRSKTQESNDESCGNDKICELSSGTSIVENIMPDIDTSQQLSVSELSEQKRILAQPLMERISMTASSEGPKPNADMSCSQEKKKRKRKRKMHEIVDEGCDLSVGTSSGGNVMQGVDLSEQPTVAIFPEQEIEVEQPLAEQIRQTIDSESPKDIEDLSCSQNTKKRKRKKNCKNHESNDNSCDPSAGTSLVEKIIPGTDPSLQSPLVILSEQELKVPQLLMEESTFQEKNEGKELNKRSNDDHEVHVGLPQVAIEEAYSSLSVVSKPTNIKESSRIRKEQNSLQNSADGGSRNKIDTEVNSYQISDSAERSLVTCPKKKLLILDLNGLLADIVQMENVIPKQYKPDAIISRKKVFKRPYCEDFLSFCFDRFNVGVWSSRNKKNVDLVIQFLFGDLRDKLVFFWDQSHCTTTKFSTLDNKSKPLVLKELRKLWDKVDPDLPWTRGEYNESNTIFLDDSPYKALRNPVNTAVFPYPYKYRDKGDKSLGPGGDIRCYLEELLIAENVQKYVEKHPFGQRPITKSSHSWEFYSKVLED